MVSSSWLCGERDHGKNKGLWQHFSLWENCPPTSSCPDDRPSSFSLSVQGTFQLLPQCWSPETRKSPRKFMCGLFKMSWLGLPEALCLPQPQSLQVFIARSYGNFSCWHWNPGLGAMVSGGMICSSQRTSAAEIALLTFIHHTWVWDQLLLCCHPSYHPHCGFLFNSLVTGLPLSQISGGSEWCLFSSSAVILMWLREEVSTVFTHATILPESQYLSYSLLYI